MGITCCGLRLEEADYSHYQLVNMGLIIQSNQEISGAIFSAVLRWISRVETSVSGEQCGEHVVNMCS